MNDDEWHQMYEEELLKDWTTWVAKERPWWKYYEEWLDGHAEIQE
jgi:hypothetical protein